MVMIPGARGHVAKAFNAGLQQTPQAGFEETVEEIARRVRGLCEELAPRCNAVTELLLSSVVNSLQTQGYDGRAVIWRVRLRLYEQLNLADPIADSDPNVNPMEPGETRIASLSAVAEWISNLAAAHHAAPVSGLDSSTLSRKIKGLRTQMSSRGDGTGRLRANYTTVERGVIANMLAVCEVWRESDLDQRARRVPGVKI